MDISRLKKRMGVIAADGRRVGFVKRMAWPDKVQLTSLSAAHGYDHVIPVAWIESIDRYVFLNRSSTYVAAHWQNLAPKAVAKAPVAKAKAGTDEAVQIVRSKAA